MSANLENSAMATGLENVSYHSNHEKGRCQRIFKLPYNCTHLTSQQGNVQNPSNQALTVHELRTSRCTSLVQKMQRNQRSNCQHLLDYRESKGIPENIYFCFIDYAKAFDCVDHKKLKKILEKDGNTIPPYLLPKKSVCKSRSNNQNRT